MGGLKKLSAIFPRTFPGMLSARREKKCAAASRDMGSLILSHGKASIYYFPGMTSDFLAASSGEEVIAAVFSPGLDPSGFAEKISALLDGYKNLRVYGMNNETSPPLATNRLVRKPRQVKSHPEAMAIWKNCWVRPGK